MPAITLHHLLRYTNTELMGHHHCPILWDLREPPSRSVRHVSKPRKCIAPAELAQLATSPPVTSLHVTCDIFPYHWPIEAHNPRGVTISDLFEAIYAVVQTRIRRAEWTALSEKQQNRISEVFDQRWQSSPDPWRVRANGVIRADCLLHSASFSGLSVSFERGRSCILTLSRNSR